MKKYKKEENWLIRFYKENVMYVWIVIGILMISGFSIGISMGKLNNTNLNVQEENNVTYNSNIQKPFELNSNNDIGNVVKNENENIIQSNKNVVKNEINDSNEIAKEVSTPVVKLEEKIKKLEFEMPLEGNIVKEFSNDNLIYSNTLQEWLFHSGIDILAALATPVKAIEAGTVIDIKDDPRYGYIIIIDHGQGYESVYCNLSTIDMVTIDKKVTKGQVISGVGKTALFEINDEPHLHFELLLNGINVNPSEYIK